GFPNLGPCIIGGTDYAAFRGYTGNFRTTCAPASPAPVGGDDMAAMGQKGTMTNGAMTTGKISMNQITDGTSNTLLFAEDTSRMQVYVTGFKAIMPNAPGNVGW